MTSTVQVEAWELQLVDPSRNHNKFYRLYVIGTQWAKQWGPIGSVGQFQFRPATSTQAVALSLALRQSDDKEAEGYNRVSGTQRKFFDVPSSWLSNLAGHKEDLDFKFRQATGGQTGTWTPSLDPNAMTEAELRAEAKMLAGIDKMLAALDEPVVAPQPAAKATEPAPTSMEAKLAAALAKRKAAQS